uniref:Polynucleotide 5'-hydroxyl-kinase NOL9 n=1 Tax=Cacopsylla melanoneura TaxID=428564 RepID=A0A8D9ETH6_9HEMI
MSGRHQDLGSNSSVDEMSGKLSNMSTQDLKKKPKQKKKHSLEQKVKAVDISTKKKKIHSEQRSQKVHETEYRDISDTEHVLTPGTCSNMFEVKENWEENEASGVSAMQNRNDDTPKTNGHHSNVGRTGTMNLFDKKKSNFSYYLEANRSALLRCCPNTVINFNGVLNVKVLQGSIRIAGYMVTKHESRPIKVYSLNSYTYIPIELLKSERDKVKTKKLTKAMREIGVSEDNMHTILECLEPNEILLYIQLAAESSPRDKVLFHMIGRLNISIPYLLPDKAYFHQHEEPADLLEKHLKTRFFKTINNTIGAPVLTEPPEWSQLFSQCVQPQTARLVLCGGSGVGKTTLLRYLINRSVAEFGKALVIDLDPGQTEFYLPGTLSATVIDEPIFGPNFVHILNRGRLPEKCLFLGDVKIHSTAHYYIDQVCSILNYCHTCEEFQSIPWFVNTMGYVRDQGMAMNCRIIQETRPTHVVQIQGKKPDENFPSELTPNFVRQSSFRSNHNKESRGDTVGLNFELIVLDSVKNKPFDNMNKSLKPADKRKNVLIAYWSPMYNEIKPEYSVNQLTPYGCQLKHLSVECVTGTSGGGLKRHEIFAAMNGEMVALCVANNGTTQEQTHCLGYGIVYCIDPDRHELFILTPLDLNQMARVKTLLLGSPSLSLPRKFLDARCKELYAARLPYAVSGEGQITSKTTSRSYRQPAKFRTRASKS